MKFMRLLSYIFPQTIAKLSSRYNKEIRINEEHGRLKLLVNGSIQSGRYIEMLWKNAFEAFGLPQSHSQGSALQILVLGVGGGTVIRMLHKSYPNAEITGVDIDPVMITIAKTYFGLEEINGLSLVCEDAQKYIEKSAKENKTYDLIIVDVFVGPQIPEFVSDEKTLQLLKDILNRKGCIIINYLRELEYGKKSTILLDRLAKIFPEVTENPLYNNRFFKVSMVK